MPHRAGFWVRVLATGIDVVAMLLVSVGAVVAIETLLEGTTFSVATGGLEAAAYVLCIIYTSFEIWTAGTPAKLLLRLRICNADCSPADFWRLFLRWSTKWSWLVLNFLFLLSGWPPLYLLAGFLSLLVLIGCFFTANDDRLTWHDQWSHTAVCHRPRRSRAFSAIVPPPPVPPPLPPAQPPSKA